MRRVLGFSQVMSDRMQATASSCARVGLDWVSGRISSWKQLLCFGTGCPRGVVETPSVEVFKRCVMWHLGMWWTCGVRWMVGLDGLKGPFQPK